VLSTLIDFVVAAAVMVILMVVFGIAPTWRLAFLPIWLMLLLALAVGLGLYTSALMVRYRDMQYAIPVLLQFLFYASPVPYPLSAVPDKLRLLFQLNPLTGLLEAFRWSLLGQGEMSFRCVGFSVVVTALVFIFGAVWFKRMERSFADVI